jgi:phosphoglycerate dehydrogenase-like enzyme
MHRIAVLDDYQQIAHTFADWSRVPDAQVVVFNDHVADEDALAARLEPFDILVAMRERTPFPRSLLSRLPNLKLLVTAGVRNRSIDLAAAAELGIPVCGTRNMSTPTVELTWALILATARHVPQEDAAVRAGGWQHTVGTDLAGATLGVIGLGRLGERVARIGTAFGMDVVAWSQNLTDERAAEVGVRRVEKEELLESSDVVTIHLVLSDRSRGLIGATEFGLMKPTAVLINTSRGPIVDEAALIEAIRGNRIGGAGIDVYDVEPLPVDHPLRELRRVVLTPHIGYGTRSSYQRYHGDAVDDVLAWLDGNPVRVISADGS